MFETLRSLQTLPCSTLVQQILCFTPKVQEIMANLTAQDQGSVAAWLVICKKQ